MSVVIRGQSVVVSGETESWLMKGGVAVTDEKEQGYSYSKTVVRNAYNEKGQLTGAAGRTEGRTNGGQVRDGGVERGGDGD
ncbi:MAG: hypothetical protein IPN90_13360 [Elusimicrobia bacterium]|nr:hypothetical protein [Elusimicrobiota bacterium]